MNKFLESRLQHLRPNKYCLQMFKLKPGRLVFDAISNSGSLKQFYELLIQNSDLIRSKSAIFVKDGGQRPALHFTQAPYKTACSMLALVAMDEYRVAAYIQEHAERIADDLKRRRTFPWFQQTWRHSRIPQKCIGVSKKYGSTYGSGMPKNAYKYRDSTEGATYRFRNVNKWFFVPLNSKLHDVDTVLPAEV